MNKPIDLINLIILEAKSYDDFKDITFDNITKIHLTIMDNNIEWLGMTIPNISNNNLVFELYVQDTIIDDLFSKDEDKCMFSKSVILHELYHIKELVKTNNIIDIMPIYNIKKDCTRSMLINLGYRQWTEYYAHFNSAKYYCSNTTLSNVIYQSEITLSLIKQTIVDESQVQLFEFMYNNIAEFIATSIKFIAIYNESQDISYLKSLRKYEQNDLYINHYNYIHKIIPYMDELYHTYPTWVSEEKFLEIGKTLFSIIHEYGITYSTPDLSDNFIFVSI